FRRPAARRRRVDGPRHLRGGPGGNRRRGGARSLRRGACAQGVRARGRPAAPRRHARDRTRLRCGDARRAAGGGSRAGVARARGGSPLAGRPVMFALPPAIVAGELVRLQTRQHVIALTFDGGGNAAGAKRIIRTLRRNDVPATFFLTGRFVRTYPSFARVIGRRFVVGNHTVDHADLTRL